MFSNLIMHRVYCDIYIQQNTCTKCKYMYVMNVMRPLHAFYDFFIAFGLGASSCLFDSGANFSSATHITKNRMQFLSRLFSYYVLKSRPGLEKTGFVQPIFSSYEQKRHGVFEKTGFVQPIFSS